jgi:pyruvate dehydrogenase E2 component (dihydrolipoamide acetyltransferase)
VAELRDVTLPDLGGEADVIEVLVAVGDVVALEDPLVTLESDKASMDVPSTAAGRIHDIKVKVGDRVTEGTLILTLEPAADEAAANGKDAGEAKDETGGAAAETSDEAPAAAARPATSAAPPPRSEPAPPGPTSPATIDEDGTNVYASPSVRRFARQLGVDLTRVQGTGRKARILKEDVESWVKQQLAAPTGRGSILPEMPVIDFSKFGEIERRKLTRIQKIAGPNLQRSWLNAPHVTQNDWADITEMERFRKAQADDAKARGIKLTPLAFLMKAAVAALEEYPTVNASLDPDGEHLVLKRYYHLGIAVDTPEGLMVPVIRDVDRKGLLELAAELGTVSEATREGKLKPDQLRGASFTISSLGGIGGSHFSPIVNTPEVAILGVARAQYQPVWDGAEFQPRLMLPLSLSYDHRVIDGALAVRFTTYLGRVLADLRRLLL